MSDERRRAVARAFVRDICEHPGDDTPRLVFADWLDEHGQEERAEFIRVQCELATPRLPYSPWCKRCGRVFEQCSCSDKSIHPPEMQRLYALRRREQELESAPRALWTRWCAPLTDLGPDVAWTVRRGFVAEVRCPLDVWLRSGPGVVTSQPVTGVGLTDREPLRLEFTPEWAWMPVFTPYSLGQVPWGLANFLGAGGCRTRLAGMLLFYTAPSREGAVAALSYACVAWARELAGLPPLAPRGEGGPRG